MVIEDLLALEHEGWRARCDGTGSDFYGRVMTSEGVMILAHGEMLDRQAVVDSLNEATPWRDYDIADEHLIPLDDEEAVLVYTCRAYRDGDKPTFEALVSSAYTRQAGSWRLALHQQTPIPADT
jgi:hypothetical protein